ncbi:MAG: hypothetical protein HXY46_02190 [Syntrophaceae bacterium]|nr:hypothetical protein [Syntrophaceae bacterium]
MEFVQRKTADSAVEHFLREAEEKGVSLVWDRYEDSLPQCGFCETGLNCRDCLQGPCISHPFRDQNKVGVCGKDKDVLGVHSFLRLVLQGAMGYLDQLSDFVRGVGAGEVSPKRREETKRILKEIRSFLEDGATDAMKRFPQNLFETWKKMDIYPDGMGRALFKVSQKLDGGTGTVEDTLLWAFKAALAGCAAQILQGRLKTAVFGEPGASEVEVNFGTLQKDTANIILYGHFSPLLKRRIAEAAKGKKVNILGVCTDPFLPPYTFPAVTNYGSQEVPLMTGAVSLVVAGDQCVNPSLMELASLYKVGVVSTEILNRGKVSDLARKIVERAQEEYHTRREKGSMDIPGIKESAVMGFSIKDLTLKKVVEALGQGKIKGIVLLAGCNNVKFTQDQEIISIARTLLRNDVFCLSEGCASVSLAKYGLLNPKQREASCGKGLLSLLSSLGKNFPAVVDLGSCENGTVSDFLISLANTGKKAIRELPVVACFPEANRAKAVVRAAWTVAMGIPTYFWPFLPVTGSRKTMDGLATFCEERFGARLHVVTQKMESTEKARMVMESLGRR